MDPQDNTFPIPPADNNGGSTPPVAGQPTQPADVSAAPYPPPVQQPTPEPISPVQPQQPSWTDQAMSDAAGLPPGNDNYSLTNPNPAPTPLTSQQPLVAPSPDPTTAPATSPTAGQVPMQASSNLVAPFANDPNTAPIPTSPTVPTDNTLDLSNQPASQPVPLGVVETGAMQPGVDVSPNTQIGSVGDQAYPMAPQTPAAQTGLPTDLMGSYNDSMTGVAAEQAGKKKGPLKIILIVVAVIALLLIVTLAIVFSGRNQRKPAIELNEQTVPTQTSTTDTAKLPDGYKLVNRNCFSFGIVQQTTINFDLTDCRVAAKFGATSQYTIKVENTNQTANLQDYTNTLITGTKVSQENIKMGGIDSIKIVETVNGVNQQLIVTITNGKNYTFDGAPVNSFILITTYNDADSKTVGDNVVKTWIWK